MSQPLVPSFLFVDSDDLSAVALAKVEGVSLAVAKRVFGEDPKSIIEELNEVLVA